jgi:hypothetical protein
LHATHSVCRPSAQDDTNPSPTAHDEHGIHADLAAFEISFSPHTWHAPSPPSLYSPSLHWRHTVSTPSEQDDIYPSPTAHDEHGMHADLTSFEISFSPQARHSPSPPGLYSPSPQAMHCVSRPSEHNDTSPNPTAQEAHGIQALCSSFSMLFSGQGVQPFPPPPLNWFVGQAAHADIDALRYFPTGHGRQALCSPFATLFSEQG